MSDLSHEATNNQKRKALLAKAAEHSGFDYLIVISLKITKFLAERETKLDNKVLQSYSHGSFTESDVMDNVPFHVPQIPPSNLPFCGIIEVSYQIQVKRLKFYKKRNKFYKI